MEDDPISTLSARPNGILLVVGVVALGATWIFGSGVAVIILPFLFAEALRCGLRVARGGYGSWFSDGRLHWQYPNWLYRKSDYCRISDLAEFQTLVPPFGDSGGPDLTYRFLLKNGTVKSIDPSCFGYFTEGLIRGLQKENPTIVVARVERDRSGRKRTQ